MKTVFDPRAREELIARLQRLTADTKPRWGKFTATKMLVHANDAIRMNIGDLAVAPKRGPLRNAFMRWLMIYVAPWPKGAPTAPELLARGKDDAAQLEAERATFTQLLAKAAARQGSAEWPDHPAFGPMREKDVGALMHKHIDHHWRQFRL